jgi:hypothetical protein
LSFLDAAGQLGQQTFDHARVVFTATADTSQITHMNGVFEVPNNSPTILSITGLPTAILTLPTVTINTPSTGFMEIDSGSLSDISLEHPALANYDLSKPIGPLFATGVSLDFATFDTSAGTFTLSGINFPGNHPGEIQASTGKTRPAPEPASLILAGLGAAALLGYGWRNRRSLPREPAPGLGR